MWEFANSSKKELLQKTTEILEASQVNNELLAFVIKENLETKELEKKELHWCEADQLKAAYALNLCTVSVSQIIDYNDIQFLEREYDGILNNLNLEAMPKDESLIHILKQLLDVISFFQIQEGEKKMLEIEYTNKVKNAIWSAIPSPSMIVTSGTPLQIAGSLALIVGTSFMNYKKEKSRISIEKTRKDWELQRSAMEQFNGLRRELFDTAWRLAKEYNFPDEFRITERQITQYNKILIDADDIRRYERLNYIKDKFKAYPPFWYYLGNAANAISQLSDCSDSYRHEYKQRALSHFNYFLEINEQNLLREDQLVATCALEKFDLIDDHQEKIKLLEIAIKSAGNALDVLQLCAVSYMKIGEIEHACSLLGMLVNENYNEKLNTQLLSKLYVSKYLDGNIKYIDLYHSLSARVESSEYMFPMPSVFPITDAEKNKLNETFLITQKDSLLKLYAKILSSYIDECEFKYNEIWCLDYEIYEDVDKFMVEILVFIKDLLGEKESEKFRTLLIKSTSKRESNYIESLEHKTRKKTSEGTDCFKEVFEAGFLEITEDIKRYVNSLKDMGEIASIETHLYKFIKNISSNSNNNTIRKAPYEAKVLGKDISKCIEIANNARDCLDILKKYLDSEKSPIFKSPSKAKLIPYDDIIQFDAALKVVTDQFEKVPNHILPSISSIFAIYDEKKIGGTDIVFTTEGIIILEWLKVRSCLYKDIHINDTKIEIEKSNILIKNLEIKVFEHLINDIKRISSRGFEQLPLSAIIKSKLLS